VKGYEIFISSLSYVEYDFMLFYLILTL